MNSLGIQADHRPPTGVADSAYHLGRPAAHTHALYRRKAVTGPSRVETASTIHCCEVDLPVSAGPKEVLADSTIRVRHRPFEPIRVTRAQHRCVVVVHSLIVPGVYAVDERPCRRTSTSEAAGGIHLHVAAARREVEPCEEPIPIRLDEVAGLCPQSVVPKE